MEHQHTKAYDSGYDYFLSGGRDHTANPFPDGTTRAQDWKYGFEDAKESYDDAQLFEQVSDIINH